MSQQGGDMERVIMKVHHTRHTHTGVEMLPRIPCVGEYVGIFSDGKIEAEARVTAVVLFYDRSATESQALVIAEAVPERARHEIMEPDV